MQNSELDYLDGLLVIKNEILALIIAIFNLFDMTVIALIPKTLTLNARPILTPSTNTMQTAQEHELWSKIGKFKHVLSTPSSQNRFNFSGREKLYTAYIP